MHISMCLDGALLILRVGARGHLSNTPTVQSGHGLDVASSITPNCIE